MQTNRLDNLARPRLASGFRSPVDSTGVPTPDLRRAEVEPPCGRERSESPLAKSRAQPRDREQSRKTYPERSQKPPFLIATRTYSREKSTHCKQKAIAISNRHKIQFGLAGNRARAGASKSRTVRLLFGAGMREASGLFTMASGLQGVRG
jgi:hypothetical protein